MQRPSLKKQPTTRDGLPVPFPDGETNFSVPVVCLLCFGGHARVRSIKKGAGRGGYAVQCPVCASTMFLCRPESVLQWRAFQALLKDPSTVESLKITLAELAKSLEGVEFTAE